MTIGHRFFSVDLAVDGFFSGSSDGQGGMEAIEYRKQCEVVVYRDVLVSPLVSQGYMLFYFSICTGWFQALCDVLGDNAQVL